MAKVNIQQGEHGDPTEVSGDMKEHFESFAAIAHYLARKDMGDFDIAFEREDGTSGRLHIEITVVEED